MSVHLQANVCTCEQSDPGGVDPGCNLHGSHPCINGSRDPHIAGEWGRGCCAHCIHQAVASER